MPTQEMIYAVCEFIAKEIIAEEDKEKGEWEQMKKKTKELLTNILYGLAFEIIWTSIFVGALLR